MNVLGLLAECADELHRPTNGLFPALPSSSSRSAPSSPTVAKSPARGSSDAPSSAAAMKDVAAVPRDTDNVLLNTRRPMKRILKNKRRRQHGVLADVKEDSTNTTEEGIMAMTDFGRVKLSFKPGGRCIATSIKSEPLLSIGNIELCFHKGKCSAKSRPAYAAAKRSVSAAASKKRFPARRAGTAGTKSAASRADVAKRRRFAKHA